MKTRRIFFYLVNVSALALLATSTFVALGQTKGGTLSQIIIYKGDTPGTGVGLTAFKLAVGEEITVTAKGVDAEGNDVPIWPTWKADKELSIRVVEGRSKTAVIKALKEGAPVFFSAIYITDEGKKVIGEVMGEVTKAKK
ncbi:MAG: hypothetical protein ACP5JH_02720 [Bacteroidota bacterium]